MCTEVVRVAAKGGLGSKGAESALAPVAIAAFAICAEVPLIPDRCADAGLVDAEWRVVTPAPSQTMCARRDALVLLRGSKPWSCDWSEKLTIHQDIACQGAYWKQRTMSVFVACAHYRDMAGNYREESVFVSADKCDQSAEASTTALVKVIECLLQHSYNLVPAFVPAFYRPCPIGLEF
ncbi:hypothetical protein QJQ45_030539 [Haematococcus lacustris]|nr:hypothetical protein QJQ45_030539 [Haematococcus lacustris]